MGAEERVRGVGGDERVGMRLLGAEDGVRLWGLGAEGRRL